MIIHIIVSTLVVPPNVNPHNKCIWTRVYYLIQDIEHRNLRQATRVLCHDHMVAFGSWCQERRSREPFVYTYCWMRFSTDCYCPNRWMYHFHAQPALNKTTPNHPSNYLRLLETWETRHHVPTQIWKLPSRPMASWWPWQRTPRKWRMMKPLQGSKPFTTATWKHWRKTQRPVCGYNTSIWYGFSVS